ncbi:MAG: hypothetical protein K6T63_14820 [Alicyclobacillus herbarius]|nr:hypothetical protein [Alicyclobacillus herbarius]MCL6633889.1 hypothetical protein [Alicyclobacillus herbarius]
MTQLDGDAMGVEINPIQMLTRFFKPHNGSVRTVGWRQTTTPMRADAWPS